MSTAEKIAKQLQKASDAYYNTGKPTMTDKEFDDLKDELERLDPNHPFLKQIGAPIARGASNKVELPYWMGSLDKIRDDEAALAKWVKKYPGQYVMSDKLDGISALVTGDGKLYTRGDGSVGQDISHLIPVIKGIPQKLSKKDIAVRGELIIRKSDWSSLQHLGANARNMVSGVVNAKKPDLTVASHVRFVAYEMIHPRKQRPSDALAELASLGFEVVDHHVLQSADLSVNGLSQALVERKSNSDYEVDGVVVAHDDIHRIIKGKNPAYGFAFKSILTHEEAEVIVDQVTWNVSKDGYLKPLVHFAPTTLSGVTISKATGFNAAYIEANVIGPGSRIVVIRSGDVIPHILRVTAPATSNLPSFPTNYVWNSTHIDIVVEDSDTNAEMALKRMVHFCKTLDVKNVAEGTLRRISDAGFNTIPKLLALTVDDLLRIEGFQKTSSEKIVRELAAIRDLPRKRLMVASNIFGRGLGEKKISAIIDANPIILTGSVPSVDELSKTEGIGAVTATMFRDNLPAFFEFINSIDMHCVAPAPPPQATTAQFASANIVFTGFRDKELEALITSQGGKVISGVSKNTTFVVAANPSENNAKLTKARELGITILSKDEFRNSIITK